MLIRKRSHGLSRVTIKMFYVPCMAVSIALCIDSVCVYSVQIQTQFGKIWSAAQSHLANKLMNKTISAVTT